METKRGFRHRKRGIDAASANRGGPPSGTGRAEQRNDRPGGGRARGPGAAGRLATRLLTVCLTFLAASAAGAEPSSHEIIWAHPDGNAVKRFVVFVSSVKGDADRARRVDVGKPEGHLSGTVEFFSALVTLDSDEFVAIAAVGYDGRMGALSGWSGVRPSRPGQPIVITP